MTAPDQNAEAPVSVGTVLAGKYRVDKILGQGGMGVVVAATHLQLDEPVAMKFLHANVTADADIVARFQREAKAARKIKSEHVVRILDVGELENGAPFMVMEYLEGIDLDHLLRSQGPQSVSNTVDYVLQACEALAEAHVQGMVHRDLKPANLFLAMRADRTALVKVLDFGISKVTGQDGADLGMTKTNSHILGSPLYMAPEQMRSLRGVDARTDIWALGVILHELLAGSPPFTANTVTELCATILQDPTPSVCSLRLDVPPALDAAIMRCLEKDPAARYGDVAALAMDLHGFASPSGRAAADRIFGVYRAAGQPSSPTALESARTMSAPAPVTGPQQPEPRPGAATTGKAWSSAHSLPASAPEPPANRALAALVIGLVALVAVLATIVVVFVVIPGMRASAAQPANEPVPVPVPVPVPESPKPSGAQIPVVSASAPVVSAPVVSAPAPVVSAPRPRPAPAPAPAKPPAPDCNVPYVYDAQGKKHWKPECLN